MAEDGKLSHINARGEAQMVDVGAKDDTQRTAIAEGLILMASETLGLIERGEAKKGDVIAVARVAGIMAAKRTHDLIPMCHPLLITKASVEFAPLTGAEAKAAGPGGAGLRVTAEVRVRGQTGVEMEALTAVSAACLTLYDMLKAADRAMTITGIRLLEKDGGRSGHFVAAGHAPRRGGEAT